MGDIGGDFEESGFMVEAQAVDRLEDFGGDAFREPLAVLLDALAQAPLGDLGRSLMRRSVIRSLANRLRTQYWFDRVPEIAEEVIAAPIVVVGMMRSGTTLVQRLLAADPRHYCVLGWEAIEPAPPIELDLSQPDPRIAAAEARDEQARTFAADLYAIHPTYAHWAEEEIMFLADAFLSHVPEANCDVPSYRRWLDTQDFAPAYDYLYRTLQLLQWQKRRRGEDRQRWVLKTPAHLGYLPQLFAQFPDAHVVHMHRSPLDTVPSGASLNATLWRMHQSVVDPARVGAQWIERMAWTNERAMAVRTVEAGDRFSDVWYGDAVARPIETVAVLYDRLGIELSDEASDAMRRWLQEAAAENLPRHRYRAEDFGLTGDQIREVFDDYIGRFVSPYQA